MAASSLPTTLWKVPRIEPWAEWPGVVKYNSDKLKDGPGEVEHGGCLRGGQNTRFS